ncbi:MAG: HRDC domain-containing protein, partial [Candidatus Cryptobacteroides sp.]|nr:HRDC domain-containing protein [Candidatus Cryptobacteroides sp.]
LSGVSNSVIKSYNHNLSPFFGMGKDRSVKFWSSVIHQGVILHLLDKEIESYGLISVTDEGRAFLESHQPLMLTEERSFTGQSDDDDDDEAPRVTGEAGDPALLALLKDLRKSVSRKRGLQPWIIFSDQALDDMSILYPFTTEELKRCQGVGEGKARKYGGEFLALIRKYVEENEIERPEDIVIRSTESKSAHKVEIIRAIDRKLPLEDIARSRNEDLLELIDEMESIVYSGTSLNLDYCISQMMDEDDVEEIFDYFRSAETDHMEEALEELGDVYSEEELRIVRLKFICEVAN